MISEIYADKAFDLMDIYGTENKPFMFVIDFDLKNAFFLPMPISDSDETLYFCNGKTNSLQKKITQPFLFEKKPVSFDIYKKGFDIIRKEIDCGNVSFLNYTKPTVIKTDLNMRNIFEFSEAKYKIYLKDKFVCFSPETFVKIKDGYISANPMKGTIDASVENAENLIIANKKEEEEHRSCVNMVCSDLSNIAQSVEIKRFRYVDKVVTNKKTLLQVSSEISAKLPCDYNKKIGTIIKSLLPVSSIIGFPRNKSIEILKEAERYQRNFYTGVFGIFDGCKLDSGVMIRFIEKTADGLVYKSGGGITEKSNPEKEYQELIDKVYVPIY